MDLLDLALAEDIGTGDVTTEWFTEPTREAVADIVAKQSLCLAGTQTAAEVFRRVDPALRIEISYADGAILSPGMSALRIAGSARSILTAERVALNFLQQLSGVATLTHRFVQEVEGTPARILDTRKTTPGLRLLEKAAVRAGGGINHRMGLYDRAMIKDNHLSAGYTLADLQEKMRALRTAFPSLAIEIEADTLDQVRSFYTLQEVNIVLLDNMPLPDIREAVRTRPVGIVLEASGGVTLETVRALAETGVDFISIGALTHSAPAVDFSLDLTPA